MDSNVAEWLNLVFRWIHVLAGVMWIGHLWFFNFVNAQLAKTYSPESKKAVLPELMPRALYFFRWGAAYTWITGFLMFGIIYSMRTNLLLIRSSYRQPFGTFAGFLPGDLELAEGHGVMEWHDVRW